MKKVLVFHSWGIGDLIMATPMLRTLAINGYKVDLFLTSETNSLVIKNAPFINKVFVGRSYLNIFLFFKKYDYLISTACIDPKKVKLLNFIINAKHVLTGIQLNNEHRIDTNLRIVSPIVDKYTRHCYIYNDANENILKKYLKKGKNIGFAIGSGSKQKYKRWDITKFRKLIQRFDANKLVFIGPDERELEDNIRTLNVTLVKENINNIIKIISNLDILIGNDNGLMHIGYATGIRTFTIFGMTNEKMIGGYDLTKNHAIYLNLQCRPCIDSIHDTPGCNTYQCLMDLTVDTVYDACIQYL